LAARPIAGRGLICVALTEERLAQLEISPMVARSTAPKGTAFHVSVDHRTRATTGISAGDRASTIAALADPTSRPADFTRPGHVFPLAYREGGVLKRAGHTEASVDLARMAGLRPAGVLCQIAGEDGEMARLPALLDFAAEHDLLVVTISDLIAYDEVIDGDEHLALVLVPLVTPPTPENTHYLSTKQAWLGHLLDLSAPRAAAR